MDWYTKPIKKYLKTNDKQFKTELTVWTDTYQKDTWRANKHCKKTINIDIWWETALYLIQMLEIIKISFNCESFMQSYNRIYLAIKKNELLVHSKQFFFFFKQQTCKRYLGDKLHLTHQMGTSGKNWELNLLKSFNKHSYRATVSTSLCLFWDIANWRGCCS